MTKRNLSGRAQATDSASLARAIASANKLTGAHTIMIGDGRPNVLIHLDSDLPVITGSVRFTSTSTVIRGINNVGLRFSAGTPHLLLHTHHPPPKSGG
jgi:hypothetical protein